MTPQDCQLPPKFQDWYPGQEKGIINLVSSITSDKRGTLFSSPTGTGKTPMIMAACMLLPGRKLILTGTIPLQKQFIEDFSCLGLVEIKGQKNYRCLALDEGGELDHWRPLEAHPGQVYDCESGPCKTGEFCSLRERGCLKFDAIRAARDSKLVIANYAYWMAIVEHNPDVLGKFDLLLCDEGHTAPDWVVKFNTAEFTYSRLKRLGLGDLWDERVWKGNEWQQWAKDVGSAANYKLKQVVDTRDSEGRLLLQKLSSDCGKIWITDIRWIVERTTYRGEPRYSVTPLWAAPLVERTLFSGIDKIVLTSATLTKDIANYVELDPGDFNYLEVPSSFDAKRRPIIYIRFSGDVKDKEDLNRKVCLNMKSTDKDYQLLVDRLDKIIEDRQDRKGIVLPFSFGRADQILARSRWTRSGIIFGHERGSHSTNNAVRMFKNSCPPKVLCSRNVGTGFDFPYRECDYVVIFKVPMVPVIDEAMKARKLDDPRYINYLTAMEVIQNAGRGMRAYDDQCEILILDGNWEWFRNTAEWPRWFRRAMRVSQGLPEPIRIDSWTS